MGPYRASATPETPVFHRGPIATPGQRIGLLGGSFDPPHGGHVHITRWALRNLALDRVWWLVSPGNPLKARGPAAIERRLAACRALIRHPRVTVTDIERHLATRYTADTLARLARHYPGVRFVWLMGSDSLAGFHRWQRWDWIMANTPIGVLARPGEQVRAGLSPAARRFAGRRLPQGAAALLGRGGEARWALLTGPMSPDSSTAIRARGDWV
ncbi:MAG: nicotinate-nucleotide adenylyltransferase [Proteobacteria bacterium]|nr:nicotinate-nucleotide adenylyltransferase [Pseudomonadota bacterium]